MSQDALTVGFATTPTLRDYLAGQALAGMLANVNICADVSSIIRNRVTLGETDRHPAELCAEYMARLAYTNADAMLAARGPGKAEPDKPEPAKDRPPIDTFNKFAVVATDNDILILRPPTVRISHDDARNLAAHLAVMAYNGVGPSVPELIEAIEST